MAVPWDAESEAQEAGECELVSEIAHAERAVFRVRGCAIFTDPDGTVCRIRSAAEKDASLEYRLVGELLSGVVSGELVFRGPPSMLALGVDGQAERIASERLEWCVSQHKPIVWRPQSPECCGEVVLRFVDASTLRHRDRAAIVPRGAEIRLRPSRDFKKGQIYLIGFEDVEVSWGTLPGLEILTEKIAADGSICLQCEAGADPPAEVSVHLTWPAGRELDLSLPYPSSGSRFIAPGGHVLANAEVVPVDRLSGVIATGTTTDEHRRYFVSGELHADDVSSAQVHVFGVNEPLKGVISGRFELDLRTLQDPLRNLLAVSRDLDAYVRLVIDALGGSSSTQRRLMVSRFDLSLAPDRSEGEVRLGEDDLRRLSWEELESLHVEATPLWDPDGHTVVLEPVPGPLAPGRWEFDPGGRAAGPWMILGRDGDWNRMRPLLWEVPGKEDQILLERFQPKAGGALATAVCISNPDDRARALDELLVALADDCGHEDWHQIYAFLHQFRGLPASTLDVTERMIAAPRAAVVALLGAPDAAMFSSVWSLLEELPFLWSLLPAESWVSAGRSFESSLRSQLEGYAGDVDVDAVVREPLNLFFKEAPKRQSGFETLTELVRVGVLGDEIESTRYLRMVVSPEGRQALQPLLENARQALLHAHAEDRWTSGPIFSSWRARAGTLPKEIEDLWHIGLEGAHYRVPVLNAPAVAAIAAACGISVERPLVFELRRLRSFDEQWFDRAYSYMLAIAIGTLLEQDPQRIGMER